MSDDLKDVSYGAPQRTDEVAEELSQLGLRQTVMEELVGNLETQALYENRKTLEVLSRAAGRLQEAEACIKKAEVRLQRSVGTNIGRQKTIQKLRKRVGELEKALREHLPVEQEHLPVKRN